MANSHAVQLAETIRAMKVAMRRRAAAAAGTSTTPPSDDEADAGGLHTNRDNKRKRSAQHATLGKLDSTSHRAYRENVTHATYTRPIIARNPQRYDSEGELAFTESEDEVGETYTRRENAFGEVKLEELLKPLTSAAEIATHPGYKPAWEGKQLGKMVEEVEEMLRVERARLAKAKMLLARLRGDADWAPCGVFESEGDDALFDAENGQIEPDRDTDVDIQSDEQPVQVGEEAIADVNGDAHLETSPQAATNTDGMDGVEPTAQSAYTDIESHQPPPDLANPLPEIPLPTNGLAPMPDEAASTSTTTGLNNLHAMTTRARARSPASRTPSPAPSSSASIPTIHPWFLPPTHTSHAATIPDTDLGLPAPEAEETRRLLLLYTQKTTQTVRALATLAAGLQHADRQREFVLRSAKASAHFVPDGRGGLVTEMSDGEDWYDLAEWGIREWEVVGGVLEKGKDEDVEAAVGGAGDEGGEMRIARGAPRRRGVRRIG